MSKYEAWFWALALVGAFLGGLYELSKADREFQLESKINICLNNGLSYEQHFKEIYCVKRADGSMLIRADSVGGDE